MKFGKDGNAKWEMVVPHIPWPAANAVIVADRHLPDGKRQHMVLGSVKAGLVIANADVIGQDDVPDAEFANHLSHLSGQITDEEKKAALRFLECCEDGDSGGYDVPKQMMKRLAVLGLVRHKGGGWYEGTPALEMLPI